MKNRATQTAIHIAGCVLFLALPFLFSPDRSLGFFSVIRNPGYFSDLTRYALTDTARQEATALLAAAPWTRLPAPLPALESIQ